MKLDVSNQAVPAKGTSVVWTYVLPPASVLPLPTGTYTVNVVYIGYYDNGSTFETPGFPIAVELDATSSTPYGCATGKAIVCGTDQQNLNACGTP
jgi:hypothetical protein